MRKSGFPLSSVIQNTSPKWKFSVNDFSTKFEQIRSFLQISTHVVSLREKCPYLELLWSVFSPNVGKCGTRITPNTDTFYTYSK